MSPPSSDSTEVTPQDNVVKLSVPIRYEPNLFLSRWGWENVRQSGVGHGGATHTMDVTLLCAPPVTPTCIAMRFIPLAPSPTALALSSPPQSR